MKEKAGEAGRKRESLRPKCRSDKGITNPKRNLGAKIVRGDS